MLAETLDETPPSDPLPKLPKWEMASSDFGIFAALFFSCMFLASGIFGYIAKLILSPEPDADPPLLIALSQNLGMQAGLLIAYLIFVKIVRAERLIPSATQQTNIHQAIFVGLKWMLIAFPIMYGVGLISHTILNALGFEQVMQDPIRLVLDGGTNLEKAFIYGMIVAIAPICEEFAFRGAIFRFLHHRLPLFGSIVLSATLFALLHVNLYSFAPLVVIGATLALAYRESGSLISPIAFHAVFNSINLARILLFPDL